VIVAGGILAYIGVARQGENIPTKIATRVDERRTSIGCCFSSRVGHSSWINVFLVVVGIDAIYRELA
jgi:hypothetical protein